MFCKSQIGRSMIEMLGVLAIIGVLSVGGLAGYSKAMHKYKVNEAVAYIWRLKMEVQTRIVAGTASGSYACTDFIGEPKPAGMDHCQVLLSNRRIYAHFVSGDLLRSVAEKFWVGYNYYDFSDEAIDSGAVSWMGFYNGEWHDVIWNWNAYTD